MARQMRCFYADTDFSERAKEMEFLCLVKSNIKQTFQAG